MARPSSVTVQGEGCSYLGIQGVGIDYKKEEITIYPQIKLRVMDFNKWYW